MTRCVYYVGLYAGNSEYLEVLAIRCTLVHMTSENPSSADNQQERFCSVSSATGHYLAGFADGEGSFNISFRSRNDYRSPWKVSACFNISQKEKEILEVCRQHLNCGTLRSRPDGVWYYEVNMLKDLQQNVIPFFQKFPFLSQKKKKDFATFCAIVSLLKDGKHLFEAGVREILDLRRSMNNGGKRKFSEEQILNQYRKSSETIRQTP